MLIYFNILLMYGLHINSDIKTLNNELTKIVKLANHKKLKCLQLFVNINHKYKSQYDDFKNLSILNKVNIIVHLSYTINIAQNWDEYSWWITQLIMEIKLASHIGAKIVVLHLGKKLDLDVKNAINNMYSALLYVLMQIKDLDIKILLETSSGQGSEMCITLDELSNFINNV